MEWRFNGRENPCDALPYAVLIEHDDPGERQRENDALIRREASGQARRPC